MHTVFHEGEQAMQRLLGVEEKMRVIGNKVIRDYMPDQHREFFAAQRQLFVGGRGEDGYVWASVLYGPTGFVHSPDPRSLEIQLQGQHPEIVSASHSGLVSGDPLSDAFSAGAEFGLLGLEFHTRRRNRVNVRVNNRTENRVSLSVQQSFGNCPKYIQQRQVTGARNQCGATGSGTTTSIDALNGAVADIIAQADTIFIASSARGEESSAGVTPQPNQGFDVSHRGGLPGFLIVADNRLWIPDYRGNNFFNTLGNLRRNPEMGLLVLDFTRGTHLYLSGIGRVEMDQERIPITGIERAIAFELHKGIINPAVMPFCFSEPQYSDYCLAQHEVAHR
jgi:predicted pyridoxine 5'-phosphate oxidase superfamily flavin-nucleotide-binding protein